MDVCHVLSYVPPSLSVSLSVRMYVCMLRLSGVPHPYILVFPYVCMLCLSGVPSPYMLVFPYVCMLCPQTVLRRRTAQVKWKGA